MPLAKPLEVNGAASIDCMQFHKQKLEIMNPLDNIKWMDIVAIADISFVHSVLVIDLFTNMRFV